MPSLLDGVGQLSLLAKLWPQPQHWHQTARITGLIFSTSTTEYRWKGRWYLYAHSTTTLTSIYRQCNSRFTTV